MRRIASLVFLLAFAFTQASAVECPMASAAHHHAAHAMHMGSPAGHHPTPHSHAPEHGQVECGIVMGCGAAAVATDAPLLERQPAVTATAPARAADLYASPSLAIDSPPPRSVIPA